MESDRLQQLQSLLNLLERTAFIGVWTLDLAPDRLHWSDQLAAIHDAPPGFTPAREDAFALYAPEWREQVRSLVQACATAGEPFDEEMQIVTLKGRRPWVRTIAHAVRDETGRIVRVEGAVQEIAPQGHRAGHLAAAHGQHGRRDGRRRGLRDGRPRGPLHLRRTSRPSACWAGRRRNCWAAGSGTRSRRLYGCDWRSSSGARSNANKYWRSRNSTRTCRTGSRSGAIRSARAWRCTCAT